MAVSGMRSPWGTASLVEVETKGLKSRVALSFQVIV